MKKIIAFLIVCVTVFSCNQETKKEEQAPAEEQRIAYAAPLAGNVKEIPKNYDGGWYYPNGGFPANPGDTVLMEGFYAYCNTANVKGVYFKQKPGAAQAWTGVNGNYGWVMMNGTGNTIDGIKIGGPNGKYIDASLNIHGSDSITIKNCEILNAKIGIFSNLNNKHYKSIVIKDNYIHNISDPNKSNFSEAMYLGSTDGTPLDKSSIRGLVITGNILDSIGGDGIQIANGVGVYVANNRITNYGLHKIDNQWFGLLNGGGTSGLWENNYLFNGMGTPGQILGTGDVTFKNNTFVKCAQGLNQDIFYVRQSFPTLRVRLIGNKADTWNRTTITQVTPGLVVENTGNQFGGVIVTPPNPPARVDSVAKSKYDSLLVVNAGLQKKVSDQDAKLKVAADVKKEGIILLEKL